VLLLGPLPPPTTGQALALQVVHRRTDFDTTVINNNFENKSQFVRFVLSIRHIAACIVSCIKCQPRIAYISIKRSCLGLAVDCACLFLSRLLSRSNVVLHLHGGELTAMSRDFIRRLMLMYALRSSAAVVVLSSAMADEVRCIYQSANVHIVPNFSSNFPETSDIHVKASHADRGPLRVLYLSNLMYSKGILDIASAVNLARQRGVDVELEIAGSFLDDEHMTSEQLRINLQPQINSYVRYLGSLNDAPKWEALLRAQVLALPTFYKSEAQPICLIEGLAYGCVPLSTYLVHFHPLLEDLPFSVAENRNIESIVRAIMHMSNNRTHLGNLLIRCHQLARSKFTTEQHVLLIEAVLAQILDNQTAAT